MPTEEMGLFDHAKLWMARLSGNRGKVDSARKSVLMAKAESLEKGKKYEEAITLLIEADEPHRAAGLASRAGEHRRQGDILSSIDKFDDAARAYEKIPDWALAGNAWETARNHPEAERCWREHGLAALLEYFDRQKKFDRAGKELEKAGRTAEAAEYYERGGHYEDAERCYRGLNRALAIAEMYSRKGDHARAAEAYEEGRIDSKACEEYVKAGRPQDAARVFARLGSMGDKKYLRRAAECYREAKDNKEAAHYFERGGDAKSAAECLLESDPKRAAELFEQCGEHEAAASALQSAGDEAGAAIASARQGDPVEAARMLSEQGRHIDAGDLLRKNGKNREAAEEYRLAKRYEVAAQIFIDEKDFVKAAACLEEAGFFGRAEKLFRYAGDDEGLQRMLARRGSKRELARFHIKRREFDEATRALQGEDQDTEVCGLLAHCFRAQGLNDQALIKYKEVAAASSLTATNVGLYYEYARLLEDMGKTEKALEVYDSILAINLDFGDVLKRIEGLRAPKAETSTPDAPDRYRIIEEIDRGGEAIVYKAEDTKLGRMVAMKYLAANQADREMLAEARKIAALTHPNIVTLHEVCEYPSGVYLVLEYLEGETLKARIENGGPLPTDEVKRIGGAICAALEYAHSQSLVHRDVKPSNVMLMKNGDVKVLDFGMAKSLANPDTSSTLCGTPFYMAPEQILCRPIDERTDVYGLGATLYQAVTGEPPFTGDDIFYQHLNCFPAPARSRRDEVPAALDALLLRCLEKKPGDRPATARDVSESLEQL